MKQTTVELEDFAVKIRELNLRDIRKVLANIQEVFETPEGEELNLTTLMGERYDVVLDIASGFIVICDPDFTLEDITPSDLQLLIEPFKEVNSSFLALTGFDLANIIPAAEPENKKQAKKSSKG